MANAICEMAAQLWGTPDLVRVANPEMSEDTDARRWFAELMRAASTPRAAAAQFRYTLEELDVRHALASIQTRQPLLR